MSLITRCRCGLPSIAGICCSFVFLLAPFAAVIFIFWRRS